MKITEKLNHKKILIWGYGREGKSTEKFIRNYCDVESVDIFEGKPEEIDESKYDLIIKSPGIYMETSNEKYTSQTELFLSQFSSQVIGITGTKGKSTTSTLLYKVLRENLDQNVLLVGNIGFPCLDYYGEMEKDTVVVYELSCHQLNHLSVSPHIAVFLNLFEDHLDYYKTRERYFLAKKSIAAHQSPEDILFIGDSVPFFETPSQKRVIGTDPAMHFDMKLKGEHNQYNARFVYEICTSVFGCDPEKVKASLSEFAGLSHRLEFVDQVAGVDFYDDSISTIPEATIQAVTSISNAETVIIGGMERNINYDILIEFIPLHHEFQYILSYESGKRIYNSLPVMDNCYYVKDLQEAVCLAKQITGKGKACILSPAAASYGYFKNFEERGNVFQQLIRE